MLNIIDSVSDSRVKKHYHIAINVIGFQIGWFSCVLMAARGTPAIGALIALCIVSYAIISAPDKRASIDTLIIVSVTGSIWDSALTNAGLLVFDSGIFSSYFAPYWIITMWLLFSTTLNVSLRWLYNRPMLSALLGFVLGPLAYQGGAALGAVEIPDDLLTNTVIAAGWAIILPGSIKIAQMFEVISSHNSTNHVDRDTGEK